MSINFLRLFWRRVEFLLPQSRLFATLTIYWNSARHPGNAPLPSITRAREQCMDVNTSLRRGGIGVYFSKLPIHLSSLQPGERLLPLRTLIKLERINTRCLRKVRENGLLGRTAKQGATGYN